MAQKQYTRIKKITIYIVCFLFLFLLSPFSSSALEQVKLYLFYSKSCPHCADEKVFLADLQNQHSNLEIEMLEVTENPQNADLLTSVKSALGTENSYVPYTVIDKVGLTGYSENTARQIKQLVEKYSNQKSVDIVSKIKKGKDVSEFLEENNEKEEQTENVEENLVTVPILGDIDPKKISLPLLAIVMGTIDGFNPCAMWVLLFLIGMLIGMKDRKKMWILGLVFLGTSAFIYLLFMVSWLKIALSITSIAWIRAGISLIAFLAGVFNIYQFVKSKDAGCTIVKEEKRKKIFSKIRKITSERKFIFAILGIMALAVSVNLVELACSAGLPLLFTQVLALNNLYTFDYAFNIFIYILFFLIDDLIIFVIAMLTMKVSGLSNRYAKYSHLIGGILMIIIGILLFFKPEWLMFQFS